MYPEKPLQKGDIYIRVAVFLMSLFLTLVTASGVYVGIPERISGTNDFIYTLAFNEYWAVIPFSIAVVSLFAIIYAWLSVFGRKKEGDL